MVLPLLGFLPTIFSAITGATELFDSGRKVVEAVTGAPSRASSPEELEDEVRGLPEDKQAQWVRAMRAELARYEAETDRIDIEGGRIDGNITSRLSGKAADKIAVLRQSTRPWAVRMAMHFILLPVYLALVDVAQGLLVHYFVHVWSPDFAIFPAFETVFGIAATAAADGGLGNTVIGQMYVGTVGWLTGIVVAYMGLREYGKVKGTSGDLPQTAVGSALTQAGGIADRAARLVERVQEVARKL